MFDAVDLHGMNDRVDSGENFRDTIYAVAEATPEWGDEIRLWHARWIEMAAPVIDHSLRLKNALQARGVPVFRSPTSAFKAMIWPRSITLSCASSTVISFPVTLA